MFQQFRPAIACLAILTLLTGVAYPLAMTAVAQLAFAHTANGSIITENGKPVGSELIGQPFDDPRYFWGRPSATTPAYNGGASSGSNLGPLNPDLTKNVQSRIEALRAADQGNTAAIPVDLVTSSASGLDPHISIAAADFQIGRVARMRGLLRERFHRFVEDNTEHRQFGIFGEPRVNVLRLNLAIDAVTRSEGRR